MSRSIKRWIYSFIFNLFLALATPTSAHRRAMAAIVNVKVLRDPLLSFFLSRATYVPDWTRKLVLHNWMCWRYRGADTSSRQKKCLKSSKHIYLSNLSHVHKFCFIPFKLNLDDGLSNGSKMAICEMSRAWRSQNDEFVVVRVLWRNILVCRTGALV